MQCEDEKLKMEKVFKENVKKIEENAKSFENITDTDLYDYFLAVKSLYNNILDELIRRLGVHQSWWNKLSR